MRLSKWEIQTRGGQRFAGGIVVVAQNAHTGHIVHDLAHALGGVVGGKRPVPDLYDTVLHTSTELAITQPAKGSATSGSAGIYSGPGDGAACRLLRASSR